MTAFRADSTIVPFPLRPVRQRLAPSTPPPANLVRLDDRRAAYLNEIVRWVPLTRAQVRYIETGK